MGSQFCRGGVPTGVCGEGDKGSLNWRSPGGSHGNHRADLRSEIHLCRHQERRGSLLPPMSHLKSPHKNSFGIKYTAMF